jgi:hypothetical protein
MIKKKCKEQNKINFLDKKKKLMKMRPEEISSIIMKQIEQYNQGATGKI